MVVEWLTLCSNFCWIWWKKDNPACNINHSSPQGNLLTDCKVIIWDEATMSHKAAFEALDWSLQDLHHNNCMMDRVIILLAGDKHYLSYLEEPERMTWMQWLNHHTYGAMCKNFNSVPTWESQQVATQKRQHFPCSFYTLVIDYDLLVKRSQAYCL